MSSISIQSCIRGTLTCPSFTPQKPGFRAFKSPLPVTYKSSSLHSTTIIDDLRSRPIIRIQALSDSATTESATEETSPESSTSATPEESAPTQETEKPEAVVAAAGKGREKPRLVLKFIWMEKNIGLGLDQAIPGHGTIPLSPYFFWPRKDAWEELKSVLESKPWISQKKMIILLNQATDIINLWQQSGGNLSSN